MKDIRERCEAATAGPWVVLPPCGDRVPTNFEIVADTGWICDGDLGDRANAEFIAHAREDIPRLLARIDELEAELHGFKLLITGGEDAPGHADTLTLEGARALLSQEGE